MLCHTIGLLLPFGTELCHFRSSHEVRPLNSHYPCANLSVWLEYIGDLKLSLWFLNSQKARSLGLAIPMISDVYN